MKKIKTTVTYKVEAGQYCNFYVRGTGVPDPKNVCRFCVKNNQGGFTCAMYNELLTSQASHLMTHVKSKQGLVVNKLDQCIKACAKGHDEVEDLATIAANIIDPKVVVADTIKEYKKIVSQLVAQGYPQAMAESAAEQALTQ